MRFPPLAHQSEIDRRLATARPRMPTVPSLPWVEAMIGLSMLVLLQSVG